MLFLLPLSYPFCFLTLIGTGNVGDIVWAYTCLQEIWLLLLELPQQVGPVVRGLLRCPEQPPGEVKGVISKDKEDTESVCGE